MRHIGILGAGTAGMELIKQLRLLDPKIKITLIDKHLYYFNRRDFVSNLSFNDSLQLERWSRDQGIEFIQDKVDRVNPKRLKVFFKQNQPREFDLIAVCLGAASKKLEVKGDTREGFAYLADIDPFLTKNLLKISSDVTVYVSTILGIRLALALKNSGKDTVIVANNLDFLGDNQNKVMEFLKAKNITVYLNASVSEAIGEGVVKAVKINPLKVFSSQMLFLDSGFFSDHSIFEEPIDLKSNCLTQYQGLYCLGAFTQKTLENERFFAYNYTQTIDQAKALAGLIIENKPLAETDLSQINQNQQNIIDQLLGQNLNLEISKS